MQHDFATTAAQLDITQVGAARRYATKNWYQKNERTAEKGVMFTQDYNKKRGPDHGSEQRTIGQDVQRRNQNYSNDGFLRNSPTDYQKLPPRSNLLYGNNHPNHGRSYDQRPNQSFNKSGGSRSQNESFNNQNGHWQNNGRFSRSPLT